VKGFHLSQNKSEVRFEYPEMFIFFQLNISNVRIEHCFDLSSSIPKVYPGSSELELRNSPNVV
jgi:hypothetical protein